MNITITWKKTCQITPDDWAAFTEVQHFKEADTLKDVHEVLTKNMGDKNFNAEIHFNISTVAPLRGDKR